MTAKHALIKRLIMLGEQLNFDVLTEVQASESAYVDVVWFDKRLPVGALGSKQLKMRYAPVLPVAAFEVELHTGLNAKHVKGSVSNLSNLGALLGVVVLGKQNLDLLKKQKPHANKTPDELERTLRDRVYRWVYAEAQPRNRVIVMFESAVDKWTMQLQQSEMSEQQTAVNVPLVV